MDHIWERPNQAQNFGSMISSFSMEDEMLAAQIADQRPGMPVILISGKNVKALREQAIALGAFAFFAKPLELSALFDAITRAVGL